MEQLLLPAVAMGASVALFAAFYRLVRYETYRGERWVLVRVRGGVDWVIGLGGAAARWATAHLAAALTPRYKPKNANVDSLLRNATHTPLTVTHTDNHLSKMREHKTETALTTAQRNRLRKKKLEERF